MMRHWLVRTLRRIASLLQTKGPVRLLDQEAWLQTADLTYCSARLLFVQGNPYLQLDAGYLLHQAIEKYAKTLLAFRRQPQWGHNLTAILRRILALYREIDGPEVRRLVEKLDHLQELRYADTPFRGGVLGPEDLLAGDLVVKLVRERLPQSITEKGIRSFVNTPLENYHLQLVVTLAKDNSAVDYWKNELRGISSEVDKILGDPTP